MSDNFNFRRLIRALRTKSYEKMPLYMLRGSMQQKNFPFPVDPPVGWTCPVRPIDPSTGAALAACGEGVRKAERTAPGIITMTCSGEKQHRSELAR